MRAALIVATSIFLIVIIASNARLAGSVIGSVSATGVNCQFKPHLFLHQQHALSGPPMSMIASQYRSVSARSAVVTRNGNASVFLSNLLMRVENLVKASSTTDPLPSNPGILL